MKKLGRVFLGMAGFGLFALIFMPESGHRAVASNPGPVIVTKTALPVQVHGFGGQHSGRKCLEHTQRKSREPSGAHQRKQTSVQSPDAANNPVRLVVNTPACLMPITAPEVGALHLSGRPIV